MRRQDRGTRRTSAGHRPIRRLLVLGLVATIAVATLGGAGEAGASTDQPAPAVDLGNRGWYHPDLPSFGFAVTKRCDVTALGYPTLRVVVRTLQWASGARINSMHFKARLVPEGTDGQLQLPYPWSYNNHVSFATGVTHAENWAVRLPQQAGDASWDIEVKMKFGRSFRPAFRHKFRIRFDEPDCGGVGTG